MIIIYITADNLVTHEIEDRAPVPKIKRPLNKRLSATMCGELGNFVIDEVCREYELIAHNPRVLIYQEKES